MHRRPADMPTMGFDWGSIKWLVMPDSVEDASSTLGEVIINPNKGHARHVHPAADEVLYVIAGEGRQPVADGDEFVVRAGDAIWIPRNTPHSHIQRRLATIADHRHLHPRRGGERASRSAGLRRAAARRVPDLARRRRLSRRPGSPDAN